MELEEDTMEKEEEMVEKEEEEETEVKEEKMLMQRQWHGGSGVVERRIEKGEQ